MMEAYGQMFQQMTRLEGIEIIGLPAVEIYRTTQINPDYDLNHTDIYLPVRKI
jgi:predicted transcriptional regulator YdeE